MDPDVSNRQIKGTKPENKGKKSKIVTVQMRFGSPHLQIDRDGLNSFNTTISHTGVSRRAVAPMKNISFPGS